MAKIYNGRITGKPARRAMSDALMGRKRVSPTQAMENFGQRKRQPKRGGLQGLGNFVRGRR